MISRKILAGLLALAGAACGDGGVASDLADAAVYDAQPEAEVAPETCHEVRVRPDGTCCPPGHMFATETATCESVGPPECAAFIFDEPERCVPRWCWDWTTDGSSKGEPCTAGSEGCRISR